MSTFFDSPAYKLNIGDLKDAQDEHANHNWTMVLKSDSILPPAGSTSSTKPSIPSKEMTLKLNIVWIQGVVKDFIGRAGCPLTLHIYDSTGEAFIHEYNKLPGGDHPKIVKGAYVGVLGQIWSVTPAIVIKGAKVMYLQENPVLKQMWSNEVLAAKAFLLDILIPNMASSS